MILSTSLAFFLVTPSRTFQSISCDTNPNTQSQKLGSTPHNSQYSSDTEERVINIYEKSRVSVVGISTFTTTIFPFIQGLEMNVPTGTGSGFVWDKSGHIVTNFHVIESAFNSKSEVIISFLDRERLRSNIRGEIRGVDMDRDIAVIRLLDTKTHNLEPVSPGISSTLRVGQTVLAVGNPFGLEQTLTRGIISGLGRQVATPRRIPLFNQIQTDAAINPGNSGGVLLDINGKVIGMNTAILSASGAFSGVGFAIPIDTLRIIVEMIIRDGGPVIKPQIGLDCLQGPQAQALGVTRGVAVLSVSPGSAAALAGIRGISNKGFSIVLGDVIVNVNGKIINSEADFLAAMDNSRSGDTVNMTVLRTIQTSSAQPSLVDKKKTVEIPLKLKLK